VLHENVTHGVVTAVEPLDDLPPRPALPVQVEAIGGDAEEVVLSRSFLAHLREEGLPKSG
jgi:hypothetical protein